MKIKSLILCLLSIILFLNLSITVFSDPATDALKKGEALIKSGNVNKALLEFRRAVALKPKSKTAEQAQYLISVYTIDIYSKIIELKNLLKNYPKSEFREEAQIELVRLYYLLDKYPDSKKYLEIYIKENKDKGKFLDEAYYWYGQINLINKNYSATAKYFNLVNSNYPKSDVVLIAKLQLSLTFIKTGNYMEARKILEKIWLLNDNFKSLIDEYLDLIPESGTKRKVDDVKKYGIQCGAFSNRENAFKFQETLKKKNYGTVFIQKDGNLYKVIIGYYSSLEETNILSRKISESEKIRVTIVQKK